jgi:hypothetical protein
LSIAYSHHWYQGTLGNSSICNKFSLISSSISISDISYFMYHRGAPRRMLSHTMSSTRVVFEFCLLLANQTRTTMVQNQYQQHLRTPLLGRIRFSELGPMSESPIGDKTSLDAENGTSLLIEYHLYSTHIIESMDWYELYTSMNSILYIWHILKFI